MRILEIIWNFSRYLYFNLTIDTNPLPGIWAWYTRLTQASVSLRRWLQDLGHQMWMTWVKYLIHSPEQSWFPTKNYDQNTHTMQR